MAITTPFEAAAILIIALIITGVVVGWIAYNEEQEKENKRIDEQNEETLKDEIKYHNASGDPLIIAQNESVIEIPPLFPDQYEAWDIDGHDFQDKLFYFDYDCDGKNQMGDRNPVGTLTLYIDYDKNERITDGCEVMWSYYTPVHEILAEKDSNDDGKISLLDNIWPKVRMSNWDESWTPKELGYTEFDLTGYIPLQHDTCHGFIGTYANGAIGYLKDEKYYECIEQGWEPIEPITQNQLRVVGYNPCGGLHEEYGCITIYSGILGYWEKVQ